MTAIGWLTIVVSLGGLAAYWMREAELWKRRATAKTMQPNYAETKVLARVFVVYSRGETDMFTTLLDGNGQAQFKVGGAEVNLTVVEVR